MDLLLRQVEKLNRLARERIAQNKLKEEGHQAEVRQLLRFGVCPCVVMGRYSTCCAVANVEEGSRS